MINFSPIPSNAPDIEAELEGVNQGCCCRVRSMCSICPTVFLCSECPAYNADDNHAGDELGMRKRR